MSARAPSRAIALALSAVPGWGHIYWGREFQGLGLFTAAAVGCFAIFNGFFLYLGAGREALLLCGTILLAGTVVWTWWDILGTTSPRRLKAEEERRLESLRAGTMAYLRGDLPAAEAAFLKCVHSDPADVEATFRLGVVCSRTGEVRKARGWLRRARRMDVEEKWKWELGREIGRLKGAHVAASTGADGDGGRAARKTEAMVEEKSSS
ncbi:MAG TPA: hypothetical protein VFD71_01415 [Planctomycetota bacterium]|jgi:hypothetical protein|nr:hypothetical protein [Planctomycetota bacterium]